MLQPQSWRWGESTAPLANAGFLNHEEYEEHKDFSFLRALRGSSLYTVANPGLKIGQYLAIPTIHLQLV
jgi:hypothetical protein